MSRTYRNKNRGTHLNKHSYVHEQTKHMYYCGHNAYVMTKEGEEAYQKALQEAKDKQTSFLPFDYSVYRYEFAKRPYKKTYTDEDIQKRKKIVAKDFDKMSRDGYYPNYTGGVNSEAANCSERVHNRKVIQQIKNGQVDPEDAIFKENVDFRKNYWEYW